MSEQNKFTQQEIAPCDNDNALEKRILSDSEATPADSTNKKKSSVGAFFKLKSTRRITYIAAFAALAVGLKTLKISLGANQISFFYIPCWLAGAFFGPAVGFTVGAVGDTIGSIINQAGGAVNPVLILGNALNGFIFGCIFGIPYLKKLKPIIKLSLAAVLSLAIVTLGINTWGLAIINKRTFYDMLFLPATSPIPRVVFQPIMVLVNFAMTVPLYIALDKYLMKSLKKDG